MNSKQVERRHRYHRVRKIDLGHKMESLMKEFLTHLTEASYQVALKTGFRGSFISFLTDLQAALEKIIRKDHSLASHAHH